MYNGYIYSYVQIRGSVPIFWSQTGIRAVVTLTKSSDLSYDAFTKHFDELIKEYNNVLIFNLLSDKKGCEVLLSNAYIENVLNYNKKNNANIDYCQFDFHHEKAVFLFINTYIGQREKSS